MLDLFSSRGLQRWRTAIRGGRALQRDGRLFSGRHSGVRSIQGCGSVPGRDIIDVHQEGAFARTDVSDLVVMRQLPVAGDGNSKMENAECEKSDESSGEIAQREGYRILWRRTRRLASLGITMFQRGIRRESLSECSRSAKASVVPQI